VAKAQGEKNSSRIAGIFHQPVIHILLIVILGFLAYSNTFNVPFQWDDKKLILENPIVKELDYFLQPSEAKKFPEYGIFIRRYISFLTFGLNYRIHGLDVMGYHVANIAIHIISSVLVYFMVLLTFRTPFFSQNRGKVPNENISFIALFASLLFVAHPIQTEAVTYIMQRFASLGTMWYLLSFVFYIRVRLHQPIPAEDKVFSFSTLIFYLLSLFSAFLAMMTKENSLTLPFAITLYEFFFFKGDLKRRLFSLIPLFLLLLVFPFTLSETGMPIGRLLFGIDSETGHAVSRSIFDKDYLQPIERWDYLLTQPRVIVTYLRLLILPIHQNIDYDYSTYHSFADPNVYLSFLFLLSLLCLGGYLLYKSRAMRHVSRLAAFGIFWFFLTLSVESSIIPIPMVIAEYRMYLPSVGLFIAFSTAFFHYGERLKIADRLLPVMRYSSLFLPSVIVIVLLSTTYARNTVWRSEVSLWEDAVLKSPLKKRPYNNLGYALKNAGNFQAAAMYLEQAVALDPNYQEAINNLAIVYRTIGRREEASELMKRLLAIDPDYIPARFTVALWYYQDGIIADAINEFKYIIQQAPNSKQALFAAQIMQLTDKDRHQAQ